ncbi:MAG: MarR family transcriptional regulator [Anaerolineae bacterium]|jgi:DNA-binding MarR family transcriptional regulator
MAGPPEGASLDSLFAQICKLKHARIHTLLESLGLYRGQPSVLGALWAQEGLMHTELARRLHVQPATITKMLQRMEKAGFVERRPDPDDHRVSRVYLPGAGWAVRDDVQRVWRQLEAEAFAGFTVEERALLRRFFLDIRANLERVTGGG